MVLHDLLKMHIIGNVVFCLRVRLELEPDATFLKQHIGLRKQRQGYLFGHHCAHHITGVLGMVGNVANGFG